MPAARSCDTGNHPALSGGACLAIDDTEFAITGLLDQLALLPFCPNSLALALSFFDRVLGGQCASARLCKHGIYDPGAEDLVDCRGGIAGIADVGGPIEGIRQHRVLIGWLALRILRKQLGELRHLIPETGEIVELTCDKCLPEV